MSIINHFQAIFNHSQHRLYSITVSIRLYSITVSIRLYSTTVSIRLYSITVTIPYSRLFSMVKYRHSSSRHSSCPPADTPPADTLPPKFRLYQIFNALGPFENKILFKICYTVNFVRLKLMAGDRVYNTRETVAISSCVWGYHVYKDRWKPRIGENLACVRESTIRPLCCATLRLWLLSSPVA